jgi:transposase-like protein
MLSEHRDMAAAQAFFRTAKSATGLVPDQVTTDVHGSYPRAIRSMLGKRVTHRTSVFKNNRLEQDHRGIKGRIRWMRGFKSFTSAERSCRSHDELRNHLRPRTTTSMFPQTAVACFISVTRQPYSPSSRQDRPTASAGVRRQLWRKK